jgi:hypothetical protein
MGQEIFRGATVRVAEAVEDESEVTSVEVV